MTCPICGANTAGRIGRNRYYCGECCSEWVENGEKLKIYKITSDGKLYNLKLYPMQLGLLKFANT